MAFLGQKVLRCILDACRHVFELRMGYPVASGVNSERKVLHAIFVDLGLLRGGR